MPALWIGGTANFDYRSFFINYELNLCTLSSRLNAVLALVFESDLLVSEKIETPPWRARPIRRRMAEFVGESARQRLWL